MTLSRRDLLLAGLGVGAIGSTGLLLERHPWKTRIPTAVGAPPRDGILVLLTLYGGNDGLNTVIPYENGAYLGNRLTLGYQPPEVLPLGDGLALAPNLTGLKSLWDARRLAIVRGVGYPNPDRSHFRSMDIWQSGEPDSSVATGWIGRWLDTSGTDPLRAISIGGSLPRAFTGETTSGSAVPLGKLNLPGSPNLHNAYALLSATSPEMSPLAARVGQSGSNLLAVDHAIGEMLTNQPPDESVGSTALDGAAAGNALMGQLTFVARLIKAGSPTRVYGVSLGGFDTHADEKQTHAHLLANIDTSVGNFFSSLSRSGHDHRVVLMAYSEFGRRVAVNGSNGTDHGTAAPVFVMGPAVKGGFYGDEPSLTDLDQGDLKFTTDFRSVYATLLEKVIGADTQALGRPFRPLQFL